MLLHGFEVSQYYIIASLQRTGSYLLCECLANSGVAGYPTEPFSPENMRDWAEEWGLSPDVSLTDYISAVVEYCTTPNGVFGTKIHWSQIEWIRKNLGIGEPYDRKILDLLYPEAKYIQIYRKDIRGQAISSYRAYKTEEWWRKQDVFNPQIIAPDPPYSSEDIRWWERHFVKREKSWSNYFDERGITPLKVEYDDLARDWRHETSRCLTFLGEDPTTVDNAAEPTFVKQADSVTKAWRNRLDEEDAAKRKKK